MKCSRLASETHQAGHPTGTLWGKFGGSGLEWRMSVGTTVRRSEFRPTFPPPVNQEADLRSSTTTQACATHARRPFKWIMNSNMNAPLSINETLTLQSVGRGERTLLRKRDIARLGQLGLVVWQGEKVALTPMGRLRLDTPAPKP